MALETININMNAFVISWLEIRTFHEWKTIWTKNYCTMHGMMWNIRIQRNILPNLTEGARMTINIDSINLVAVLQGVMMSHLSSLESVEYWEIHTCM
jgi:hypothetical protein